MPAGSAKGPKSNGHGIASASRAGIEGDKPVADPQRNQWQKSIGNQAAAVGGAVLAFTPRRSGAEGTLWEEIQHRTLKSAPSISALVKRLSASTSRAQHGAGADGAIEGVWQKPPHPRDWRRSGRCPSSRWN